MLDKDKKEDMEVSESKTLKYAKGGIKTGSDFAGYMSAVMSDLIEGRITPQIANAACNAGGKLLKVVEMQYKYGKKSGNKARDLNLVAER